MDSTTFDTVARNLSTAVTRRSALRGLVAGALAVTVGSAALETSAKRHRKAKKQRHLQPGDFCKTDKQCNHHDPHYICGRRVFNDDRSRSVAARWTPSVIRAPTAAMAISA